MSQQTTLATPKGLSKTTVIIIVTLLLSLLAVSLSFNILSYTSNSHPPVNVQIVNQQWTEYKIGTENNLSFLLVNNLERIDTENDLYLVQVNLTLRNPDPIYAEVQVQYLMYDLHGELLYESLPTNTTTGLTPPVLYSTSYGLPPNRTLICCFSFLHLKPQNDTTQLSAEIVGGVPIL